MRCLPVLILAVVATRGQDQEDGDTASTKEAEMNDMMKITEEECLEMLDKHNRDPIQ